MLTLADASSYFDHTEVRDPTTGAVLFLGQIDPFDDSKRDSATAYRRVLSVKPGTAMPASRTVRIFGAVWLVGGKEVDGLDEAHRDKYVLHPASELFNVSTLTEYLAGTYSAQAWGDLEWVKDGREGEVSSRPVPLYNLYLPTSVTLAERTVIWGRSQLLASAILPTPSGLQVATGELLAVPVATASISTSVYDPVQGVYAGGTVASVPCLRVRWQALYEYGSQADVKYQEGDANFVVPTGTTVTTSSVLTLAAVAWRVMSVETQAGVVLIHGRLR